MGEKKKKESWNLINWHVLVFPKKDIQGSNSHSPNYWIVKKKKKKRNLIVPKICCHMCVHMYNLFFDNWILCDTLTINLKWWDVNNLLLRICYKCVITIFDKEY